MRARCSTLSYLADLFADFELCMCRLQTHTCLKLPRRCRLRSSTRRLPRRCRLSSQCSRYAKSPFGLTTATRFVFGTPQRPCDGCMSTHEITHAQTRPSSTRKAGAVPAARAAARAAAVYHEPEPRTGRAPCAVCAAANGILHVHTHKSRSCVASSSEAM
jgi:hypothetical protein